MSMPLVAVALLLTVCWLPDVHAQAIPPITGAPVIDAPANVLAWPVDQGVREPSLSEATANRLNDLHATFDACDMALTTAGNYHMALTELWHTVYLPAFDPPLRNWFYTTSPPIVRRQLQHGVVQLGNVNVTCRPQVAAASLGTIQALQAAGVTEGEPVAVIKNRGSVLLVKKGNPKQITRIYDLARPDIRVVTPNPVSEPGAFATYAATIYQVARQDPAPPAGLDAETLFAAIFSQPAPAEAAPAKWLAGSTIHHREVPWSVAYGHGDVAVLFYHLALHAVRTFPALFELILLGGTVKDPQPLPGNPQEVTYLIRLKGQFTARQLEATEKLFQAYRSSEFTTILERHGLTRP